MANSQVIEKTRVVSIPKVGKMLRVEHFLDGESVGLGYRLPANPKSSPSDLTHTFVVFVTVAKVFIATPSMA
jgi:hypothetical protein